MLQPEADVRPKTAGPDSLDLTGRINIRVTDIANANSTHGLYLCLGRGENAGSATTDERCASPRCGRNIRLRRQRTAEPAQPGPLACHLRYPVDRSHRARHRDDDRQLPGARAGNQQARAGKYGPAAGASLRPATGRCCGTPGRHHRASTTSRNSDAGGFHAPDVGARNAPDAAGQGGRFFQNRRLQYLRRPGRPGQFLGSARCSGGHHRRSRVFQDPQIKSECNASPDGGGAQPLYRDLENPDGPQDGRAQRRVSRHRFAGHHPRKIRGLLFLADTRTGRHDHDPSS